MAELFQGVSWTGVIAGAIAAFLLGWLWYSPKLFGVKWAQGVGVKMGAADEMPKAAMICQISGLFLVSWLVGVTAVSNALLTIILAVVAFSVMGYASGLFRKNSAYARAVDAGYWVVSVVVMVIFQGIF
ncbi:MAG: twitching motility protein PilT [Rhodobacteraceae bacterium]|nr:MAG: twitching motility protein PilT [Paracoccaceae bacterium]